MHYYRRHLGDYARKAGHLSMLEHGAYNLILDAYYDREVAPTRAEAIRYARARSPEEVAAVDAVLAEFFTERDGRYHQARVEAEFAEVASNAEKNRENGKKGGRPRKNPKETQPKPSGFSEETQTKGNPIVQDSKTQEQKHVQRAAARFAEFWAAYPVKKGRKDAERAWQAKGLDAIADQILVHVERMKAEDADWLDGYAPHGSTYVNGERWQDEPKRARARAGPAPGDDSRTLTGMKALQGMKHGLVYAGNDRRADPADVAIAGPHATLGLGADHGSDLDQRDDGWP